jgi:hypothetical protein
MAGTPLTDGLAAIPQFATDQRRIIARIFLPPTPNDADVDQTNTILIKLLDGPQRHFSIAGEPVNLVDDDNTPRVVLDILKKVLKGRAVFFPSAQIVVEIDRDDVMAM